jgi:hypothetical protein
MAKTKHTDRVLIAITEFSPVDVLWRAALRRIGDTQVELLALYFSEDHWQRAASLPFTREISRVSGARVAFTRQRAEQLHSEAIDRARELTKRLAAESKYCPARISIGSRISLQGPAASSLRHRRLPACLFSP